MVSKASLETLARTMSMTILAFTVAFVGQEQVQPANAENLAIEEQTTDKKAEKIKKVQKPASQRKAPKSVYQRGLWVKEILHEAGFRGQNLKEAWAIVMRESTGRPTAHNDNYSTGDNSYGIFQINMIGDLGVARRDMFGLKSNKELFNPLTNAKIAHHMSRGGEDWSSWDIDSSGYNGGVGRSRYLEWLAKYPKG